MIDGQWSIVSHSGPQPAIIILLADDVILTKIRAVLHLNDHQRLPSPIFDTMPGLFWDHHAMFLGQGELVTTSHDRRCAGDHHPMLCPVSVLLQAEPLSRLDHQTLDFVLGAVL